jgi:hypothetical protein
MSCAASSPSACSSGVASEQLAESAGGRALTGLESQYSNADASGEPGARTCRRRGRCSSRGRTGAKEQAGSLRGATVCARIACAELVVSQRVEGGHSRPTDVGHFSLFERGFEKAMVPEPGPVDKAAPRDTPAGTFGQLGSTRGRRLCPGQSSEPDGQRGVGRHARFRRMTCAAARAPETCSAHS